jgi:UDP-GlcNAc:undecaprenyl-phosphate GlcNAc-1-phosphate transferase
VLSFLLTALMRKLAARIGFVDKPGGYKRHERPMPFGGGVVVCLVTCCTVLGATLLAHFWKQHPSLFPMPEVIAEDIGLAAGRLPLLLCILAGGLAMAVLGTVDDIRPVRPRTRLILQFVIATLVVVASGMRISAFVPNDIYQICVTVLWIVALTNSFNLLDNMDGVSATVAFVCAGALLILALQTMQFFIAGFLLVLMGAVLGFLFFNFPPAAIFLGDGGSTFIGYMLATATISTTFLNKRQANPLFALLVPAIIFAVPLYDTLSVIAIRLYQGRPIMAGDRCHFSHRLQRLGKGPRRVLLTMGLMALATSIGATVPYGSSTWRILAPAIQAIAVVCVIIELELANTNNH